MLQMNKPMDLTQVHDLRRVKGMLTKIQRATAKYSSVPLGNSGQVQLELEAAEHRLTIEAITNSTPVEILMNAQRLANLSRSR